MGNKKAYIDYGLCLPIPVSGENWLRYDDYVYILVQDSETGNYARWQYNGTLCHQASVTGYVAAKFKSSLKWFNPEFWYNSRCYKDGVVPLHKNENAKHTDKHDDKYFVSYEQIAQILAKEIMDKTGWRNVEVTGVQEGYANVKYKGHRYFLTWENCD